MKFAAKQQKFTISLNLCFQWINLSRFYGFKLISRVFVGCVVNKFRILLREPTLELSKSWVK